MTTTDIDAIMRAILEEPEDDLHRLAFADWHEEYGDPTRASFVRAQIELARTLCMAGGTLRYAEPVPRDWMHCDNTDCRHCMLDQMATAIWLNNRLTWHIPPGPLTVSQTDRGYHHWFRGFVSTARCTLREFMTHAAEMFRAQPITRVDLTNRIPRRDGHRWIWFMQGNRSGADDLARNFDMLPEEIYRHLPYGAGGGSIYSQSENLDDGSPWKEPVVYLSYVSKNDAIGALSAACVRYGRIAAGLEKSV